MSTVIRVDNLCKVYKLYDSPIDRLKESILPFHRKYHNDFYALNDVSFEIKKGETIGIIGQNGSGKSTLLQIITGVVVPSSGTVIVDGRVSALLELGAGFNPELTGLENIYLFGTISGRTREETDQRMEDIINFANIGEFIHRPIKTYSSGMFIRLAFACAVNNDPDILIVDEALAVGDMQFQLKCIEKMKSFKKNGKTILFVSHDTYQVRNFCDQALWLMNGKIHMRGEVNMVTRKYEDFNRISSTINETSRDEDKISDNAYKDILSIDRVTFLDHRQQERKDFGFGEKLAVAVDYTLCSGMEGIVGGIALFNSENTYVCGLNTKLDNYCLPNKPGKYKLIITYEEVALMPGTYYVDVGFFESSGLVRLDYKSRMDSFIINSEDYFAEGLTFLKHHWGCEVYSNHEI